MSTFPKQYWLWSLGIWIGWSLQTTGISEAFPLSPQDTPAAVVAQGNTLQSPYPIDEVDVLGTTIAAEVMEPTALPIVYMDNNWLTDFEVHFLVSLPFTALYSYLAVLSLDAAVQGQFPPEFRPANTWMIIGCAVGTSLAVALGSMNRVPDQSEYRLEQSESPDGDQRQEQGSTLWGKMELLQIIY